MIQLEDDDAKRDGETSNYSSFERAASVDDIAMVGSLPLVSSTLTPTLSPCWHVGIR